MYFNKRNKKINLLASGILFFGIALLSSCENENFIELQDALIENEFEKLFNKENFKKTIPFSYRVNWENPVKQYSEELETNFYEFDLIYNTPFNPTAINKSKKKGYNTAYKLVVTENEENKLIYYIAKFFQKKDGKIEIEDVNISLNNSQGYKGLTHLYDTNNELYFAKHINKKENKKPKFYFKDEELRAKNYDLAARSVNVCRTAIVHHYIDWYRYTYDIFGNVIDVVYLYTEYIGSSSTISCTTEFQPDEPIRTPKNPDHVPCQDGSGDRDCVEQFDADPAIMCRMGFEPDEYGNCIEVPTLLADNNFNPKNNFVHTDGLDLTDPQRGWLDDLRNREAKETIENYLNLHSRTPQYNSAQSFAIQAILSLFNNSNLTINNINFEERIINELTGKIKCMHDKLNNGNNLYKRLLGNFNDSNTNILKLNIGAILNGDWGITKGNIDNTREFSITISNNIENNSNLIKMVTLAHELIHAYMFDTLEDWGYLTYDINNNPLLSITCQSGTNYSNINLNNLTNQERFIALICAMNQNGTLSAEWTHELFNTPTFNTAIYRQELENLILNEHDWNSESQDFKNNAQNLFGSNWKKEIAKAVSWIGLERTDGYTDYLNGYNSNFQQFIYVQQIRNNISNLNSNCQ